MTNPDRESVETDEKLRRFAVHLMSSEDGADLAQETFLAELDHSASRPRNRGAWLRGTLRNLSRMHSRRESRRRPIERHAAKDEATQSAAEEAARREFERILVDAVTDLSPSQRRAIVSRYFEGKKPATIAEEEGLPLSTVKRRLDRGLDALRHRLAKRKDEWYPLLVPLGFLDPARASIRATSVSRTTGIATTKKIVGSTIAALGIVTGVVIFRSAHEDGNFEIPATETSPVTTFRRTAASDAKPPADAETQRPVPSLFADIDRERDVFGLVTTENGSPVPNATVEGFRSSPTLPPWIAISSLYLPPAPRHRLAITTTDTRGRFRLRHDRREPIDMRVSADDHADRFVARICVGTRHDVVLVRPTPIRVLVESQDRQPLEDVHVTYFRGDHDTGEPRHSVIEGHTDVRGRFDIEGVAAGRGWVRLEHPRFASPSDRLVRSRKDDENILRFRLRPGDVVTGLVTDVETGTPIADALLGQGARHAPRSTTDGRGRFEIAYWRDMAKEPWIERKDELRDFNLTVRAPGYHPLDFALSTADRRIAVKLRRTAALSGRVVAPTGSPVSGAVVTLRSMEERDRRMMTGRFIERSVTRSVTDENGVYRLEGYRRDNLRSWIEVRASGYGRAVLWCRSGATSDRVVHHPEIILDQGASVSGRVLDANERPVSGVDLSLVRTEEPIISAHARTDDLGRFVFVDLPPGSYEIASSAATIVSPLLLRLGARERRDEIVLRPRGAASLVIEVRDDAESAVDGLLIAMEALADDESVASAVVRTDEYGRAEFAGLAAGSRVSFIGRAESDTLLVPPPRATVTIGDTDAPIVYRVERLGLVSGRVLVDGEPWPNALVFVRVSAGTSTKPKRPDVVLRTDADGTFECRVSTAASVVVAAEAGRGSTQVPYRAIVRDVVAPRTDLVLHTVAVARDGFVVVRVEDPKGDAAAGATVTLEFPSGERRTSRSDDEGLVEFDDLPKGFRARLVAYPRTDLPDFPTVSVVDEIDDEEIVLRLGHGAWLEGTVVGSSDNPKIGWTATCRTASPPQTSTDEHGRFRLRVPAGRRYDVEVFSPERHNLRTRYPSMRPGRATTIRIADDD